MDCTKFISALEELTSWQYWVSYQEHGDSSPFIYFFDFKFIGNLQFSTNRSCIYFVRFIWKYFILEGANINRILLLFQTLLEITIDYFVCKLCFVTCYNLFISGAILSVLLDFTHRQLYPLWTRIVLYLPFQTYI